MNRSDEASPADFLATTEVFLVQLFLLEFDAGREFEVGSEPAESELLVLLDDLLMSKLLLQGGIGSSGFCESQIIGIHEYLKSEVCFNKFILFLSTEI